MLIPYINVVEGLMGKLKIQDYFFMDKKYENIYNQFEKNFKEEAEGFIPEEDIKSTLQMEQVLFNNAYKYNISVIKY